METLSGPREDETDLLLLLLAQAFGMHLGLREYDDGTISLGF